MRKWYCIYTKPAQEDLVCKLLADLPDIETLNPKIKRKILSRSKLMDRIEALFPCYIFTRFENPSYFHTIKYTRGVKKILANSLGLPTPIDDSIVGNLKSRMKEGFVLVAAEKYADKDKVSIFKGSFEGIEGVFLMEMDSRERVMILLNAINVKVQINRHFIKKALSGSVN